MSNEALILSPLAASLGIAIGASDSPEDLEQRVNRYLETRQALLVLDNCEHLVDAAARVTHNLVASCPGITVLATSREALGLPGEVIFQVPPLSVPASDSVDMAAVAGFGIGRPVLRPGRTRWTWVQLDRQQCRDRCWDLSAPRRHPSGYRTRGRTGSGCSVSSRYATAWTTARAPHRRRSYRARLAAPDAAGSALTGAMTCCHLWSRRDSADSEYSPADSTSMLPSPR